MLAVAALLLTTACREDIKPSHDSGSDVSQTTDTGTGDTHGETDGVKKIMLSDKTDCFKITGRYSVLSSGITWDWSASGIEFDAECQGDVVMNYISDGALWFRVWVDGVKQDNIYEGVKGENRTTLVTDLAPGVHRIKVARMTDVKSSLGVICSIELDGVLLERPADNGFFVEFLGDSLTCGTGNMDGWQGQTEGLGGYRYMDATRTFAYQLANDYIVDCDYSFVSIAGSHVAESSKYENFLDVFLQTNYRRSMTDMWEYSRKADLVVINLGTNDAVQHLDTTQFKTNLGTLTDTVRSIHGEDTPILFVMNMMTNNCITQIRELIEERGGENAGLYGIILTPDSSGASSHPCGEAHDEAAQKIAEFIAEKNICEISKKK